ncbi:FAD/NAD(P)-binding domain-containing protein [Annulohypoxylon truncatum]|uniref:FAD/NAD(P)-binding domain-containing protein n=1 Tax=Annulohypoxylon truncatum TaxID=327061 RepID=UPI002008E7E1|nr:FAD/NAD(P)-binding domain-containing protein [Annulohypoxylon truncatum]KAI1209080.1 FAD/NAD(P)-binding domain-containing protein [Annulohypoxylon truncatum]
MNSHSSADTTGSGFHSKFHICIIGAGIVGLAGGILLRRYGFKVTILEKDAYGAGIQLHPNAVRVLQDLGIYDKIMTKSVLPQSMILQDYKTGKALHTLDLQGLSKKYGAPLISIHRPHFREILYDEAIAQGVVVRFGVTVSVENIDITNGILKFGDVPTENFESDLFIGADGGTSAVREALTGRKPEFKPLGRIVNRILVDQKLMLERPNLRDIVEQPRILSWLGPECHGVTYGLGGLQNIAITWPWSCDPKDSFVGSQVVDFEEFKAQFKNWDPKLRELISLGTGCKRWMFFEPMMVNEETQWIGGDGKFCIVGDAANQVPPFLAQGAALGLESASVLAHLLGKSQSLTEINDALEIFHRLRKERVGHVLRASMKNGRVWQMADGPLKDERDKELVTENDNPTAGYPNLLADPFFQPWLWGFDAKEAADEAWSEKQPDIQSSRG